MTLEDFFTLTEMKDGLVSLPRVEELVSVMLKQKDDVVSNLGDTARQWSTVASILAATGKEDCLNHFIQLNGLRFLDSWLQEAQNCVNDGNDGSIEELINALLGVLERLPLDNEKSTGSGVGITVKRLLGHKNNNFQERARALCEKWAQVRIDDTNGEDSEKRGSFDDNKPHASANVSMLEECVRGLSPSEGRGGEGSSRVEHGVSDFCRSNATTSVGSQVDSFKDTKISTPNPCSSRTAMDLKDVNVDQREMNSGSSLVSHPCQDSISITEESSVCLASGLTSSGTCSFQVAKERSVDDQPDVLQSKDTFGGPKDNEVDIKKDLKVCDKSSQKENCMATSSDLSGRPKNSAKDPFVTCHLDSKASESCLMRTSEPHPKSVTVETGMSISRIGKDLKTLGQAAGLLQILSSNRCIARKMEDPDISFHNKEVSRSADDIKESFIVSETKVNKDLESSVHSGSSKPTMDKNMMNAMVRRSERALEYGEIDALEVARQVAIEVEREVVDYREPFCSSSPEGTLKGEIMDLHSPNSLENRHDRPVTEELNEDESITRRDLSDVSSSHKGDSSRISNSIDIDSKDPEHESESSKSGSDVQESVADFERGRCDFDLNEDVCSEELDCTIIPVSSQMINLSAPIAVAASKGTPGLPFTPLHFEGELGWRGSAATSAFRPASPRRTPDGEKTFSGPKQKPNILGIDLNVAEGELDTAVFPTSNKQIPASSGLPSGDSSMEVSSIRAERLKLDLNRIGDEDAFPNTTYWSLHHQNGNRSPSPSSSSSSRHPFMRDIDLNDNPSFFEACGSHTVAKSSSREPLTYGSHRLDDPVVTIMGSKMALEKKDPFGQAHQPYQVNGLNLESMTGARSSMGYSHFPPATSYGYNGLAMGPGMSIPPALYAPGPVPYMVDSRGATVVPQILGSSSGLNGTPSYRQPFLMSIGGPQSGLNAVEISQPSLDLNSGIISTESASRDVGSFKQLFMPGHGGLMENQGKSTSQPAGSGMPLKRKEPELGWEPYTVGYKQVTSWQ